jgi:hypothetical protein
LGCGYWEPEVPLRGAEGVPHRIPPMTTPDAKALENQSENDLATRFKAQEAAA